MGTVNFDSVPEYLAANGRFCLWKYENANGHKTKVPYDPNDPRYHAASTRPETFTNFFGIINAWNMCGVSFDGVGVGVFGDIGAIDIDHCFNNGEPSELAMDIVNSIHSYTEVSPSGEGVRVFFRVPESWTYDREQYYINNRRAGLEIYVPGMTNKFLTFTGRKIKGQDLESRPEELEKIVKKYMQRVKDPEPEPARGGAPGADRRGDPEPGPHYLTDSEIIDRAAGAANGDLFRQLWSGDITGYNSQSEADQALCNILAFWTGRDAGRIDQLYRQSGLMRAKWRRDDYRSGTISKAIRDCKQIYDPEQRAPGNVIDVSGWNQEQAAPAGSGSQPRGDPPPELPELVSLDDVEEKEIDWLIDGWIPKEAVTILGAEGGAGKTSTWCHIVAKISAGKTTMLDEGYTERAPGKVLFFSSEDSADTVLKKKIRNEGGNMHNIATLDVSHPQFNSIAFENGGLLEKLISKYRPVLCVFDPVQQFIPDRVKMAERNAMRRCLAPLKRLSELYQTTFIVICHANKRDGASGRKRLADSSDLWDFARSVIMLGLTEDGARYLSQEKNNYGKLEQTVLFRITDNGVEYSGRTSKHDGDFVAAAMAAKAKPSLQRQDAEQFILDMLEHNGGYMEISAIVEAANCADISDNAMKNARAALIKAGKIKRLTRASGRGQGVKHVLQLETGLPQNTTDPEDPPFE